MSTGKYCNFRENSLKNVYFDNEFHKYVNLYKIYVIDVLKSYVITDISNIIINYLYYIHQSK